MTNQRSDSGTPMPGLVSLIGAGPGDPGLITVKGLERIRTADVVVYDYLAAQAFLDEARDDAELIYVGKKGRDHTCEQEEINDLIVRKAREGRTVARLKGGDPFVFGRGGEEAEELVAAGVPFEVIPGVTSAVAAPAYAGIPVTHRDHASMVTFITGHEDPTKEESALDWEVLARNPGTMVFLMGVKNLPNITRSLIDHGKNPDTPAALVRWGTTPEQKSFTATLATIADEAQRRQMKAPAIFLVGGVASLHEKLRWFENKPLLGRRIVVTRSRAQSRGMADRIRESGGEPILLPTISIVPPDDYGPLDSALNRVAEYDWIILTSVNGVELFFERFFQLHDDIRTLVGPRFGAIGPVTAAAIRKRGIKVDALAKEFVAEGVLALFSEEDVKGKRFLIPRAEKAREILPEGIEKMGGIVDVVPVYRTVVPDESAVAGARKRFEEKTVDAVTFTSSSTVTHFLELLGAPDPKAFLNGVVLASIGPVTSQTLRDNGLEPSVEAAEYTIPGLVQALEDFFAVHPA